MKKEYLILLLVIVALTIYLIMRPGESNHFDLPQPAPLESAAIDRIVITKENEPLELVKKDAQWTIHPQGYTADPTQVSTMLDKMANLSLSALVAESGNYERYSLSADTAMHVKAFSGGQKVREFDVGQVAPTFQHTFVKLENDPNVYHARGAFKTTFDQTADSLRDKTVLSLDQTAVAKIVVQKGDKSLTLTRRDQPVKEPVVTRDGDVKSDTNADQSPPPEKEWVDEHGKAVDRDSVEQLIGAMRRLQCDGFIKDKTKEEYQKPLWSVTFETSQKSHTLSLLAKAKSDEMSYPALSSESDSVFYLFSNRVESFEKQVDALFAPDQAQPEEQKQG